jgi:RNA polymerase-binding transcription factor
MNLDVYKRVLLDLRSSLTARVRRDAASGQGQNLGDAGDAADASVIDESESEDFSEAELGTVTLEEIDAALRRIDDGTYGRCLVDGKPIEPKRLEAEPWAVYCLEHQRLREAASRPKPTL